MYFVIHSSFFVLFFIGGYCKLLNANALKLGICLKLVIGGTSGFSSSDSCRSLQGKHLPWNPLLSQVSTKTPTVRGTVIFDQIFRYRINLLSFPDLFTRLTGSDIVREKGWTPARWPCYPRDPAGRRHLTAVEGGWIVHFTSCVQQGRNYVACRGSSTCTAGGRKCLPEAPTPIATFLQPASVECHSDRRAR
uniref:Putative secreted protein n=1 Tax=Ixodes ricinus TaxID=34613 RepID=A0A6B0V2V1_IXORI